MPAKPNNLCAQGVLGLDVEIQAFIRDGIDYVIAHPEVLDEIFSRFTAPRLEKLYGNAEIERIKKWIEENYVAVIQSWNLAPARVPCVSIHLASSAEATEYAYMGDHAGIGIEADTSSQVVVIPTFIPDAYDSTTGMITAPSSTDLTNLRAGHILLDAKGEQFMVVGPIDADSNTFNIDISLGGDVDIRALTVALDEGFKHRYIGQATFRDQIDIGIHGKDDDNTVLWLYYIVMWALFRFKKDLEKRGVDIHTFSASEFDRQNKYVQENVYSRWIRFTGKTSIEWSEDPLEPIIAVDVKVK